MDSLLTQLQTKIDNKTKPLGSLGILEEMALQIGSIQKTLTPQLSNPTIIVYAADHGITEEGVSPYPKEVTMQMVMNFLNGGAAINVFCRQNNINLMVADAGVDYDFVPSVPLIHAKVKKGTRNITKQPAMTLDECQTAMSKGGEIVYRQFQEGCNIIGFGEMGIGNTSAASLLMSKYCNLPIEQCVGRGTGLNGEGVKKKTEILIRALEQHPDTQTPMDILATFGGLEIAMMAGSMIKASELGMVIMVDGFIATSALLAAYNLKSQVLDNCVFCHTSDEHGHRLMLDYMKAKPLLNLNMRLGEGTGAAIVYPIIKAAVAFLNEMASFESACVSKN